MLPSVSNDAGDPADFSLAEKVMAAGDQERGKTAQIHTLVHKVDPQTLAWAIHDSPAGLEPGC